MTVQQVDQAVVVLGNEDDHPRALRGLRQPPVHRERLSDGCEMLPEVGEVDVEVFRIELDPHQEKAGLFVAVLVGVQNVAVMPVNEVGNGGHFALAIGTTNEQNGAILHESVEQSSC